MGLGIASTIKVIAVYIKISFMYYACKLRLKNQFQSKSTCLITYLFNNEYIHICVCAQSCIDLLYTTLHLQSSLQLRLFKRGMSQLVNDAIGELALI